MTAVIRPSDEKVICPDCYNTDGSPRLTNLKGRCRRCHGTGVILTSNSSDVPEILRSIVRGGGAWTSAGIIGEAANLLDDVDVMLGRLAECFGDDETEFADIKLMRDRIAAVDTRARHDATDESAHRHSHETSEQRDPELQLLVEGLLWTLNERTVCPCCKGRLPDHKGPCPVAALNTLFNSRVLRRSEKADDQRAKAEREVFDIVHRGGLSESEGSVDV